MTSLAEQLKRLKAPQTSILGDSIKRASILFDPKEAANNDRNVIFELGCKGLNELIALNQAFFQFEQTLFNRSTVNFERSVQNIEVNKVLNETIKRFMQHLSPYFMLQPAHMCLEWLIRRFHIHLFNKNELLQLILPYHETKIFVRCVQILRFTEPNDSWGWLEGIQRPGVPLSKSAILKQAVKDPSFLKFVCESTVDAIKELDTKAHTLQAVLAFYCTTVIGALEHAKEVTELHVSNILISILKGLSSPVLDFCAAAYMISAQLIIKTKLSQKLLHALIAKICKFVHPSIHHDSILLLVLIFQTQSENLKTFPDDSLGRLIANEWVPAAIGLLAGQDFIVSPFCVPVVCECLRRVQKKGEGWRACKSFLENLLLNTQFKGNEAKNLIRSVLDSYLCKPELVSNNEVIEIDSDEEDQTMGDSDTQHWYSGFLEKLERQYPAEFDLTVKETMRGHGHASNGNISDSRTQTLKNVLAFRFKSLYSENNIPIYENLYHHNPRNRVEAVKFLVENLKNLSISQNNELLKSSLLDCLSDDNPEVLCEVLKLTTDSITDALGAESASKLVSILYKRKPNNDKWLKVTSSVLNHIVKRQFWQNNDLNNILLSILPFLFPKTARDVELVKLILSGEIVEAIPILKKLSDVVRDENNVESISQATENILMTSKNLPATDVLLKSFKDPHDFIYFLLLATASYKGGTSENIGLELFENITRMANTFKFQILRGDEKWYNNVKAHKAPLKLFLDCLLAIAKHTEVANVKFYNNPNNLVLKIFELLITKSFTAHKNNGKEEYTQALKTFLETMLPSFDAKLNFLANFFIADRIPGIDINSELQLRAIRLFGIVASSVKGNCFLERQSFVKILIALSSEMDLIRECALKTIEILCENAVLEPRFNLFGRRILERHEEIFLDHEQFALVLFTIVLPLKSAEKETNILNDLISIVINPDVENILKAETLNILKHINNLAIFKQIIKCGFEIMDHIDTIEKIDILDKTRSRILNFLVVRFDDSTMKILSDDENAWNFVRKLLHLHSVRVHYQNKLVAIAGVVMDTFDERLYKKLPDKYKPDFIEAVVAALSFTNVNSLISSGNKLIQRIYLNGKHIVPILENMKDSCTPINMNRKRTNTIAPSPEIFNQPEWKKGITLLELLQNTKKIESFISIIPTLVELLKRSLEFEEPSNLEYAKQLILSCMLQCCQQLLSKGSKTRNSIPDNIFRIELVVQCIRATQNPQTHHHALLLLSQCATIFPQEVLLNIMDIFTFMGSSVVRHDDAFSFQIIAKIIESIVPTLVSIQITDGQNERVVPVLKVFSDIVLDVPEHRRLPLYTKLLRTLNEKRYLWMFLCVLLESYVVHFEKEKGNQTGHLLTRNSKQLSKRVDFGLQLFKEFDAEIALHTCISLCEYLRTLPMDKCKGDKIKVQSTETTLFDVHGHSANQLRHFRYVLIQFISNFTSSPEFTNRIANLTDENTRAMKPQYQDFIIKILCYVPQVTEAMEMDSEINHAKYWKVILHNCHDVLESAISLLSADMLLIVIHGLMQHKLATVRKKIIEILITKIQYKTDFFANCNEEQLVSLLKPLNEIIDTILDKNTTQTQEAIVIQQTALIAIKLLSRLLSLNHVDHFKNLLSGLTKILKKRDSIPKILLGTVVLTITEICTNLKAHSISQLSKFMPHIIQTLQEQSDVLINHGPDNVTIAIVIGMQKIFETIPLFLGPYMVEILVSLITAWSHTMKYKDEPKANALLNKFSSIWTKIASTIPLRIVLSICDKTYRKLIAEKQYIEIRLLMKLLKECFEYATSDDIQLQQSELTGLFLDALEFRAQLTDYEYQNDISDTEEAILQSFVSLILKLSESSFRPLYHKVYEWAIKESDEKNRVITYFLLSSKVAAALQSLFVLFASDFVQDAANLLDQCNAFKTKELYFENSEELNKLLVENILSTLNSVFLYDSKDFINEHRFNILIQPIVDQLQNRLVLESEPLKAVLISCLSQLACVTHNDTLWKQLNYQVLLKTRSNNPKVRIVAFDCCVNIARKLGENFVTLLPETIPFVVELFEDENEDVEKACRRGAHELEKLLGVSLQEFF